MLTPLVKSIAGLSAAIVLVDTAAPDFNGFAEQISKVGMVGLLGFLVVTLWNTLKEERRDNKKLYETLVSDRVENKAAIFKMCETMDEMKELLSNHLLPVRSVLGPSKRE